MKHSPARWPTWLMRLGVALVLALVFSWYANPTLVVDLAGRIWSCI